MKYLITSALPYVNGVKHLGNLVGSMLPADVYARFLRLKGEDVLFICATDEHGSQTELAARQKQMSPQNYCDEQYQVQQKLNEAFNLSFDYFGRSSSPNTQRLVQFIAHELEKNGFIEERSIKQYYSPQDKMFLPDRFIKGTCPHCGYTNARGDQCESCTQVLDPEELINPQSVISDGALELRETKHLFLLQSKMEEELKEWIEAQNTWPAIVKGIAQGWLSNGLQDRCITRDLTWGVPVDKPGYENKVFYVWFDAPIAYIGATKDWAEQDPNHRDFMDWWSPKADVRYTQFMGKDNVPFHTVSFPATIMGAGNLFKQPDFIKGLSWLNYYDGKFSTSSNRGIFMNQALELYPSDYWRYALISHAPEKDDVNFTWEGFAGSVNNELANAYGNFVQRIGTMQRKYFGSNLPERPLWGPEEEDLIRNLTLLVSNYTSCMENMEYRKSALVLNKIFKEMNTYLDVKAPWKQAKEGNMEDVARTISCSYNIIRLCAILTDPVIPGTSQKIYKALHLKESEIKWPNADYLRKEFSVLNAGRVVEPTGILFSKILPERIEELKCRFGDEHNQVKQHGKELHITTAVDTKQNVH